MSRRRPARAPQEPTTVGGAHGDQLAAAQVDISAAIRQLDEWLPELRAMPTTHSDTGLGFVPAETLKQLGRQYAEDRREMRIAQAAGLPVGRGTTAAPGHFTAWSAEADIATTCQHAIHYILRHQPTMPRPRQYAAVETTEAVLIRLGTLCRRVTDDRLALAVLRDLEHLVTSCDRILNGEQRIRLGACPHCRSNTLVAYMRTGVITCERPRDAGLTSPCWCDPSSVISRLAGADPLCPCHSDPKFVHTWWRAPLDDDGLPLPIKGDDNSPNTWNRLQRALVRLRTQTRSTPRGGAVQ